MKLIYLAALACFFLAAIPANATITVQRPVNDALITEGTQNFLADDLSQVFSTNAGPITYTLTQLAPSVYPQITGNLLYLGTLVYYLAHRILL